MARGPFLATIASSFPATWSSASSQDARFHWPEPRGPQRIIGCCGRSESYSKARPAEPFAHRLPWMPGACGFPSIHVTFPSSTSTRIGQRTAHMPHML